LNLLSENVFLSVDLRYQINIEKDHDIRTSLIRKTQSRCNGNEYICDMTGNYMKKLTYLLLIIRRFI